MLAWAVQIATGVATLHGHQSRLVHRDIKEENIFLKKVGKQLVADLGDMGTFLELESTPDQTRTTRGTPLYLAPELLGDAPRQHEPADIFSLGPVFLVLLMSFIRHRFFEVIC